MRSWAATNAPVRVKTWLQRECACLQSMRRHRDTPAIGAGRRLHTAGPSPPGHRPPGVLNEVCRDRGMLPHSDAPCVPFSFGSAPSLFTPRPDRDRAPYTPSSLALYHTLHPNTSNTSDLQRHTHTHTSSWRSLHTPAHRQDGHCPGTFRHGPLRSPVQHSAASLWSLEFYTGRPKCRVFHILKSSRRGNNGSSLFLPTCVQNIELPAVRLGISQRVAPRQHLPTSYEFVPDSMVNFTIPNNLTFRLIWCAGSSGW